MSGFLNLANVPVIRLLGGGQFRKRELSSKRCSRSVCGHIDHPHRICMAHMLVNSGRRQGEYFRGEKIVRHVTDEAD